MSSQNRSSAEFQIAQSVQTVATILNKFPLLEEKVLNNRTSLEKKLKPILEDLQGLGKQDKLNSFVNKCAKKQQPEIQSIIICLLLLQTLQLKTIECLLKFKQKYYGTRQLVEGLVQQILSGKGIDQIDLPFQLQEMPFGDVLNAFQDRQTKLKQILQLESNAAPGPQIQEIKAQLKRSQQENAKLRGKVNQLQKQLNDAQKSFQNEKKKLQKQLNDAQNNYQTQIKKLNNKIEESNLILKEKEDIIAKAKIQVEKKSSEIKDLNKKLKDQVKELQTQLRDAQKSFQNQKKKLNQQKEKSNSILKRIKITLLNQKKKCQQNKLNLK